MTITVVLFTCDRPKDRKKYAEKTLASLKNLHASEPLRLHIADDGSEEGHIEKLIAAVPQAIFDEITSSTTRPGGAGYGASYNAATQVVHEFCDIVLPLEEDWELEQVLDLDPIAQALRESAFRCCRLGYIGWTNELRGKFIEAAGLRWLYLDPRSEELHVFAGGPRLETVEFERDVGPWPEGIAAGATEVEVCNREQSRHGIVWPVDIVKPMGDTFCHIGSEKAQYAE